MEYPIPKASSMLVDGRGAPTREWYNFFRTLLGDQSGDDFEAQLQALAERVAALEADESASFSIQGGGSVTVYGTPQGGIVQITLEGDTGTPGPTYHYATGPDGVKGWYAVADAFDVSGGLTKDVDPATGVVTIGLASTPFPEVVEFASAFKVSHVGAAHVGKWIEYTPPFGGSGNLVIRADQLEQDDEVRIRQKGPGTCDIACTGATLTHMHEATLADQYGVIRVKKVASGEVSLDGDLGNTPPTFYILDESGNRQMDQSGNLLTWV